MLKTVIVCAVQYINCTMLFFSKFFYILLFFGYSFRKLLQAVI
jgi:hypothetical protein